MTPIPQIERKVRELLALARELQCTSDDLILLKQDILDFGSCALELLRRVKKRDDYPENYSLGD